MIRGGEKQRRKAAKKDRDTWGADLARRRVFFEKGGIEGTERHADEGKGEKGT